VTDPALEERVERVCEALTLDITYLAPADERHFDPFAHVEVVAWALVGCYLKAFLEGVTQPARDLGDRTATLIAERVKALFGHEHENKDAIAEVETLVTPALEAVLIDEARAREVDDVVYQGVVAYLASRHLPDVAARELAVLVRDAAAVGAAQTDPGTSCNHEQ
jgi:hypothetical protein